MIEEILKLREEGLSFRKIAAELNTTVGRVQYRYNKWINGQQDHTDLEDESEIAAPEKLAPEPLQLEAKKGELQLKLISPRKILLFWDPIDVPEKLTKLFFNRTFAECVHVARIYDVTDIIFNGRNAHYMYEIAIPYENGHWFVKGLWGNRNYVAELGIKFSADHYFPVLQSQAIQTPNSEIPTGNELYQDILRFQRKEDHPPKWSKHVSTYSYYEEPQTMEEKGYDLITRS